MYIVMSTINQGLPTRDRGGLTSARAVLAQSWWEEGLPWQVEKLYSGDQDGAVAQDMKNLDTTGPGAWRGSEPGHLVVEKPYVVQS